MRGGHIPGAKSIPWARAVNPDDGTFKTAEELRALYRGAERALAGATTTIAYCRIGERSSHTWFALKYLLGFEQRPQLRRQLDGVGEPGGGADREVRLARTMAPDPSLQKVLDTFAMFPDPADATELLLSYADKFREVPPEVARAAVRQIAPGAAVRVGRVRVGGEEPDGTLRLHFAVENPSGISAKALAAILEKTLSGLRPEEIEVDLAEIVEQIFRQNISMGKGMGLMGMVNAVRALAARARSSGQVVPGLTAPAIAHDGLLVDRVLRCLRRAADRVTAPCLAVLLVVSAASLAVPTRFCAASVARSTALFAIAFALSTTRSGASPISSCSRGVSGRARPTAAPDRHGHGAYGEGVVLHPVLQL